MAKSNSRDIVLTGAGVLSTTFSSTLEEIESDQNIHAYERLGRPVVESSNERNNAGTGHTALCELNYTVLQPDSSIDIGEARVINEEFEISEQFWGHLAESGSVENPREFINPLPHTSYARGKDNVKLLEDRCETMKAFPMSDNIGYTEDIEVMRRRIPLMVKGREDSPGIMAASRADEDADVNSSGLTRRMAKGIEAHPNVTVQFNHEVVDFEQLSDDQWEVTAKNRLTDEEFKQVTGHILIGTSSGAILLLQKTGIPGSKHLGGFPISGQFLAYTNLQATKQHDAKVYGKEPPGTPPTTILHLDMRYTGGQRISLFGPFANVGLKFLKNGSNLDLSKFAKTYNVITLLITAVKSSLLIKYPFDQATMTREGCMNHLHTFYPEVRNEDWWLYTAGRRVQVIKDTPEHGKRFIQFGTGVVNLQDHTVIALLNESPGASTSVSAVLEVLERNFPKYKTEWAPKVRKMIPSHDEPLIKNEKLMRKIRRQTSKDLELGHYEN